MLSLPSGDLLLIDRNSDTPEAYELFSIDSPTGETCLPLFSDEDHAIAFLNALPSSGWSYSRVSRDIALRLLQDLYRLGASHTILDPAPGYSGPGHPIFSVLFESLGE